MNKKNYKIELVKVEVRLLSLGNAKLTRHERALISSTIMSVYGILDDEIVVFEYCSIEYMKILLKRDIRRANKLIKDMRKEVNHERKNNTRC